MAKKQRTQVSPLWIVGILLVVAALLTWLVLWKPSGSNITNFQTCKDAGGAILESYPEQCTLGGKTFTNSTQSIDSNANEYVGLAEQAALDKAARERKTARVVERDGESLAITMDYSPGRLNLTVKDGKVSKVQVEGSEQ